MLQLDVDVYCLYVPYNDIKKMKNITGLHI